MGGSMFDYSQGKAKKKIIKNTNYRVLIFLAAIIVAVQLPTIAALVVFLGINAILVSWSGISYKYLFLRLLLMIPFGLGAVVMLPFSHPGEPLFELWIFTASLEGTLKGLIICLKLINASMLVTLLLATTPMEELLKTLKRLKFPELIVDIMSFTLRYLSVLMEEIDKMIIAQKARGLKMSGGILPWSTYKRLGHLIGVLFIRSFKRSERIHLAMISRGANWKEEQQDGGSQNKRSNLSVPEFHNSIKKY